MWEPNLSGRLLLMSAKSEDYTAAPHHLQLNKLQLRITCSVENQCNANPVSDMTLRRINDRSTQTTNPPKQLIDGGEPFIKACTMQYKGTKI